MSRAVFVLLCFAFVASVSALSLVFIWSGVYPVWLLRLLASFLTITCMFEVQAEITKFFKGLGNE